MKAGDRLGPYEIVGPLGAGGMGEVWRARDPRLEREVAIKLLPAAVMADVERLARFEREGKLLAQLNHPQIATIHGLEEADGTRFIVMECVEGVTLAEKIRGEGRVDLGEAVEIAIEIADALDAAHDAGIIHRDLKPANIKILPDGRVKVLDFGLAKALDTGPSGDGLPDLTHSPTLVAPTRTGVILGTAGYMSPEQVRGRRVDGRADVWALGCVLFEMISGGRCFPGGDVQEILAAVLRDEPDWAALPATVPAGLRWVLRRCLKKKPGDRWHRAVDVRIAIEEVLEAPTTLGPDGAIARRGLSPVTTAALVAVFSLLSALAVWAIVFAGGADSVQSPTPLSRLAMPLPDSAQYASWGFANLAVSPDGTRIVYVAEVEAGTQLYLRRLDEHGATPVAGTRGAVIPFFSPDGQSVGYFEPREERLRKVSLSGGSPVTVVEVIDTYGATWSSDGFIYFNVTWDGGLARVSAAGGEPEFLLGGPSAEPAPVGFWPHALPGGRGIVHGSWGPDGGAPRLELLSGDGDTRRVLLEDAAQGRYVDSGHLVYRSRESLMAVRFDLERQQIVGRPEPLPERAVISVGMASADYAVAPNGVMAFIRDATASGVSGLTVLRVDRGGTEQVLAEVAGGKGVGGRTSPDGEWLAHSRRPAPEDAPEVWVTDLVRGTSARLTQGDRPVWSRDGRWITYTDAVDNGAAVYRRRADGSGNAELLTRSDSSLRPLDWSPDDRYLLLGRPGPQLVLLDVADPDVLVPLGDSKIAMAGRFSPDGKWIAYATNEGGSTQVLVEQFPGPGARIPISVSGGNRPFWSQDGSELFFTEGGRLWVAEIEISDRLRASGATPVLDLSGGIMGTAGPDGFVFLRSQNAHDTSRVQVVPDLRTELDALLPRR